MKENKCLHCDCYDYDYGCTMSSVDREYACLLNIDDKGDNDD